MKNVYNIYYDEELSVAFHAQWHERVFGSSPYGVLQYSDRRGSVVVGKGGVGHLPSCWEIIF